MDKLKIGVGPHPKPWPSDPKYDVLLLENGDTRNVLDKYRYWTNEAIKADLNMSRVSLHVAVHIIGKKHYNRRGAMVTDKYLNIVHHESVEGFTALMKSEKRHIIAIDIFPGSKNLSDTKLPNKTVLVFGGEGPGLSDKMQEVAEKTVMIEQFGSTRSVNVGVASGIAMYTWMQQNVLKRP
jgi:tRNA(Leu) C34 or U34 (ribose-2'-O)-methylase TrmL